ncbi:Poly(A)-specific ribonuclease PARN [Thecamonas trahens ATCC 50062]|uniref:Poly(A)-specific ribonuclease PARN n=1 Tax=Thecamonas trahens ATCC 50062 TaxID=461836 RepID=A0A0L0DDD6_THETB|nr:Poly(A)-specific ribonuclease PARN [Thecamonas trahens ATCC 50062]KNC50230.1 Poly(A)-specific ribonuclease PARN [Thecamonas trahens ATCC 50062]|eukprot:XP_013757061.1 Poly(A)-specific ribonuclease PARN [Thecamonas trahens ATCC 50062]
MEGHGASVFPSAEFVQEVTKDNFAEVLPTLRAAVAEADYVAIDGEFTGLFAGRATKGHSLDSLAARHAKVLKSAKSFCIIQYGVATFKLDPATGRYAVSAWAFYVFPRTGDGGSWDALQTMQAESINFLADNGFDFNKAFIGGIGYLTPEQEAIKAKRIASEGESREPIVLKPETLIKMNALIAAVRAWLDEAEQPATVAGEDSGAGDPGSSDKPLYSLSTAEALHYEYFDTLPASGFIRRLIHQEIEAAFGDDVATESLQVEGAPHWRKYVRITRSDAEAKAAAAAARAQAARDKLEAAIGFRHVLDAIRDAKVPLVGHNLTYDLAYTMAQFYGLRTESVAEYKAALRDTFGPIYDTKLIASKAPAVKPLVTSTALSELVAQLGDLAKQRASFGAGFDASPVRSGAGGAEFHDAGFDALVTGMAFALMTSMSASASVEDVTASSSSFDALAATVSPWRNKINVMRCAVPWLDLDGPFEPVPNNVFELAGLTASVRIKQLREAVAPHSIGGHKWLDDERVLVQLSPAEGHSLYDAVRHMYTVANAPFTHVAHVNLGEERATFTSIYTPAGAAEASRKRKRRDADANADEGAAKKQKGLCLVM